MLAAAGDCDLRGIVGQPVVALKLVGNGLLQLGNAGRGRVFCEAFIERLLGGVLDVVGRVEVRFAGAESDDVLAFSLEAFGLGADGERNRGGE